MHMYVHEAWRDSKTVPQQLPMLLFDTGYVTEAEAEVH